MRELSKDWSLAMVPVSINKALLLGKEGRSGLIPAYSNADHLRESLEDLMEEYEVDMAISGHVHAYARTCNVYKERCISNDDGGTTHITLGMSNLPQICRWQQYCK